MMPSMTTAPSLENFRHVQIKIINSLLSCDSAKGRQKCGRPVFRSILMLVDWFPRKSGVSQVYGKAPKWETTRAPVTLLCLCLGCTYHLILQKTSLIGQATLKCSNLVFHLLCWQESTDNSFHFLLTRTNTRHYQFPSLNTDGWL